MSGEKSTPNFPQQAAKASWIIPLLALGMMTLGNSVMRSTGSQLNPLILGGFVILLFLVGIMLGITSLFGIKKYGKQSILAPAITGILLNAFFLSLLVMIAVAAFMRATKGS